MAEQMKYAILDTDFVSKTNIIKKEDCVLADEVLTFPEYKFFCHQKMKEELGDHGTMEAQTWLERKISSGEIICYSDKRILTEMREKTGGYCYFYYRLFLKQGCDLFNAGFYTKYFQLLDGLMEKGDFDEDTFLSALQTCEIKIGHGQSYGEVKAYVLLQALRLLYDIEAYIFCSDDFGARQGFSNGAGIPCISILSVFLKMKLIGKTIAEVEPFFQSFVHWCSDRKNPQTHVRVWMFRNGSDKREKVSVEGLLSGIYAGMYQARKDGDLQMVSNFSSDT